MNTENDNNVIVFFIVDKEFKTEHHHMTFIALLADFAGLDHGRHPASSAAGH